MASQNSASLATMLRFCNSQDFELLQVKQYQDLAQANRLDPSNQTVERLLVRLFRIKKSTRKKSFHFIETGLNLHHDCKQIVRECTGLLLSARFVCSLTSHTRLRAERRVQREKDQNCSLGIYGIRMPSVYDCFRLRHT